MSVSDADAISVASDAATIFNSEEDEEILVTLGEVSGIGNDTSDDVSNSDASNNDNKEKEEDVFCWATREIMNRMSKKLGMATMEDCRFHSFFGVWKVIAKMVWDMLWEGSLHPEKSKPNHLLWAFYFLKVYPREGPGYSAVGGSKGAINPKIMHK
jgi:hypothetical protein